MFTVYQENTTKFGNEKKIIHTFLSLSDFRWLCYSGFMHACIYLKCIMQLKQFYNKATKVSSRKKVLLLLVIYLTGVGCTLSPKTYVMFC